MNQPKRPLLSAIVALMAFLFALVSCSEDEKTVAAYVEDLACIATNANGRAVSFISDGGATYGLSNSVTGLRPDSTYRILALFTCDTVQHTVWLTSYARILAPEPVTYQPKAVVYDAVGVTSVWKGGGYVNLRLALKATYSGTHYFGFNLLDTTTSASGVRTAHVKLIHSQNNDPLYYTREVYLSMPLSKLSQHFTAGTDSVSLAVETFNGEKEYKFAF